MTSKDQVDKIVVQANQLLEPMLNRGLRPGVCVELELSFHIQDGKLNHLKENETDSHGGNCGWSDGGVARPVCAEN